MAPANVPRALLLSLLTLSCAGEEVPDPAAERSPAEAPAAAPAPAPEVPARAPDPATLGRITGRVLLDGEPPERKPLGMGPDPACREHASPPLSEKVVSQDGGLRDAFVTLRRGQERWIAPPPPAEEALLSQRGCVYVPHALALRAGQPLRVENADPTTHNVNLRAKRNGVSRNVTQGINQADLVLRFERREEAIPVRCDIHPWMSAWVWVEDHPWFALSAADGSFAIEGVPPGTYTLEASHPSLGSTKTRVELPPSGEATVELRLAAE